MDSLNLDIDSYTPFDLQTLFSLSPGYSVNDVKKGKEKLLVQLEKSKSLGSEAKRSIAFFIDTAASRLGSISGQSDPNAGTWAMATNPMDTGASHFVISNPNTLAGRNAAIADGREAGSDDVPAGWLNPINVRTVMHGVNLDTRFRENYYKTSASDFTFYLPDVQKKVTSMRIATLDIPMTYYAINRSNGSSTMLIFPMPVDHQQAMHIQAVDASGNSTGTVPTVNNNGTELLGLQNVWTNSADVTLGPTDAPTETALNGAVGYFFNGWSSALQNTILQPSSVQYGTWQGEGTYSAVSSPPEPTGQPPHLATYRAAWLLVLPDGNYETAWTGESQAMDITRAMNAAITTAQPCIVDRGSGTTYILLSTAAQDTVNGSYTTQFQGNPSGPVPFINAGLGGKLVFSVDRASGRSTFALPDTQSTMGTILINNQSSQASNLPVTPNVMSDAYMAQTSNGGSNGVNTTGTSGTSFGSLEMTGPSIDSGFELVFAVDAGGNFSPAENIQLRLGWQLGYRVGAYECNGYLYDLSGNYIKVFNATAALSEGICMITGPRYMFLCVDDGQRNVGSNFTAVFSESTLGEQVMTRINLTSTMDSTGVYKCASDAGLSNQLNRTREYFGPVDIARLKVKLIDEYGRIISFNNMDWSMSIVFDKLYD